VLIWGLPEHYACKGTWYKQGNRWRFKHECEPGRQCERRTRVVSRLWQRGFVDGVVTDGHHRLATYLSKYLRKAMHDKRSRGQKAYYASHNILRPLSIGTDSENIQALLREYVIPEHDHLTEKTYHSEWLGKVVYQQYETSYDRKTNGRNGPEDSQQDGHGEEVW